MFPFHPRGKVIVYFSHPCFSPPRTKFHYPQCADKVNGLQRVVVRIVVNEFRMLSRFEVWDLAIGI